MKNNKKSISIGDLFLDKYDNSLALVISKGKSSDYFKVYWLNCPLLKGKNPITEESSSVLNSVEFQRVG